MHNHQLFSKFFALIRFIVILSMLFSQLGWMAGSASAAQAYRQSSYDLGQAPGPFGKALPANGAANQRNDQTVTWGDSEGVDYYEICDEKAAPCTTSSTWSYVETDTSYQFSQLAGNSTYYWEVRAVNSYGTTYADGSISGWTFTTGPLPASFSLISPSNGAVDQPVNEILHWSATSGATSYQVCFQHYDDEIQITCSPGEGSLWKDVGNVTSFEVDGLYTTSLYYWNVSAENAYGYTYASSNGFSFWTIGPPDDFQKDSPDTGATNQPLALTLTWEPSTRAATYDLCYQPDTDCTDSSTWTDVGNVTSKDISGLLGRTTYHWQVRARNGSAVHYADGGMGADFTFTTVNTPAAFGKSSPVNGAPNQAGDITLSWASSTDASSYALCFTKASACAESDWNDIGNTTHYDVSGLDRDTTYTWNVRATNSLGPTLADAGTAWTFTTGDLPLPFGKISPSDGATNQMLTLTLSWNASGTATGYDLCYTTASACGAADWSDVGDVTSQEISGLMKNTTYTWNVRAKNSIGNTYADGKAWTFITKDQPGAFGKSEPEDAAPAVPLSPTLRWAASDLAESYELCYQTGSACDDSSTWKNVGNVTSQTIGVLDQNTLYYWQVRAVDEVGTTLADGGTGWTFTSDRPPDPFTMTTPSQNAMNVPLSPTFYWDASERATDYQVCLQPYNPLVAHPCSDDTYPWTDAGAATSLAWTTLNASSVYQWNVRAINIMGTRYATGGAWTFTTGNPPAPFLKTSPTDGTTTTNDSMEIRWSDSVGASYYQYCYSKTTPCTNWSDQVNSTLATLTGLDLGATYYWEVRSVNGTGTTFADGSDSDWAFSTGGLCTVTTADATGAGSLDEKINDPSCTTIKFAGDFTINSGSWLLQRDLTIDGSGHKISLLGARGGFFAVDTGSTVTLDTLTFQDGYSDKGGGALTNVGTLHVIDCTFLDNEADHADGGAIDNTANSTLTISGSTFSGNYANLGGGGAIINNGSLIISNSTFSANGEGGVIDNSFGTADIYNTTFAGNTGPSGEAGIAIDVADGTALTLYNSIVSGDPGTGTNCAGTITDGGGNLTWGDTSCPGIHQDPKLGTLADNGGPTQTIALLPGSAAINAGVESICGAAPVSGVDQRGVTRPQGSQCDIGAFELDSSLPEAFDKTAPADASVGQPLDVTLSWGASSGAAYYQVCFGKADPCTDWTDHVSGTSLAENNLDLGTAYHWQVRAVNAFGTTDADISTPWSFTTGVTCTVTTSVFADSGGLFEKVNDPSCLLIDFAGDYTIAYSADLPALNRDLTIDGSGHKVTLDGNGHRLFAISPGTPLTVQDLTMQDGWQDAIGGGIYNAGTLNLNEVTLQDTQTVASSGGGLSHLTYGGGIYSLGTLNITRSTFSGNSSPRLGGGIYNAGTADISNSTFTNNQAQNGAAIFNAGALTITNSTIAGNFTSLAGGASIVNFPGKQLTLKNTLVSTTTPGIACMGDIIDGGGNLSWGDTTCPGLNLDPKLGTLADNGGPTWTMALLPGSAAINAGVESICGAAPVSGIDQRGVTRPQGSQCDIGAFELASALPEAFNKTAPDTGATGQPLDPTLQWEGNGGALTYELCYQKDTACDDTSSTWTDVGDVTSQQLNGLALNTTYHWQVRASNDFGLTYADGSLGTDRTFTTGDLPVAFTKSAPSDGADDQPLNLTLQWHASPDVSTYELCYQANDPCDDTTSIWTDVGNQLSKQVDDLSESSTYHWQVRARNGFGLTYADGSLGSDRTFTTGSQPEAFVKTAPADAATDQPLTLTLYWDASSKADTYELCYQKDTACNDTTSTWTDVGDVTSSQLDSLSQGTLYHWQVRARNDFGLTYADGSLGADRTFTTGSQPEAFVKTAPANSVIDQPLTITLEWGDSSGAANYQLCFQTNSSCSRESTWTDLGIATSQEKNHLAPNTTYYWQVRATNDFGTVYANASTNTWRFTTGALPASFAKIAPSDAATDQPLDPTLQWEASSKADTYELCYQKDTACNDTTSTWTDVGDVTSQQVTGLALNTTYHWQVRASNDFGLTYADGSLDSDRTFTTGNLPVAFAKTAPADAATDQPLTLTLYWDVSSKANTYELCYQKDTACDDTSSTWKDVGNVTSQQVTSLALNTTYHWQVRSKNDFGLTYADGSLAADRTFTTGDLSGAFTKTAPADAAIDQPINPTLQWSASADASTYELCYQKDTACDDTSSTWTDVGDVTSQQVTGLATNTLYHWQVRASNDSGLTYADGSLGSDRTFTTGNLPGAFIKVWPLNAASGMPTTLLLDWTPSRGASSYWVCFAPVSDAPCTNWLYNDSITSRLLVGLTPGKTYTWQVKAVNSEGTTFADGAEIDAWTFTTWAPAPTYQAFIPLVLK